MAIAHIRRVRAFSLSLYLPVHINTIVIHYIQNILMNGLESNYMLTTFSSSSSSLTVTTIRIDLSNRQEHFIHNSNSVCAIFFFVSFHFNFFCSKFICFLTLGEWRPAEQAYSINGRLCMRSRTCTSLKYTETIFKPAHHRIPYSGCMNVPNAQ